MKDGGYDSAAIEAKWQERWRAAGAFAAARHPSQPKYYVYNPAPYVTGALHMGHVRNYACGDFMARLMRLRGASVLYTIGFDAYGLPTEMAAVRHRIAPKDWTAQCLVEMKRQFSALGCSFDWSRSFLTSEPRYYKWTQWIFLRLHERGLIYSTWARTPWCPQCETSLARSQVENGLCWICSSTVETRRVREWRLRISAGLPALLEGLETMRDRNGVAEQGQRNLLVSKSGFSVELRLDNGRPLTAFVESAEELDQACGLAVHPRDEETLERLELEKPTTLVGRFAVEPVSQRRFPIVLCPKLDAAFSDRPVVQALHRLPQGGEDSIVPAASTASATSAVPAASTGRAASTVPTASTRPAASASFGAQNPGDDPGLPLLPTTVWRQKDFSVSRERFWGTPIPIVLCEACGEVPVPELELPVPAPKVVFDGGSEKLAREDPDWGRRPCPRCAGPARLDPLVMDCHMDSIWHPFRPCAGPGTEFLFDEADLRFWMPADLIQFGRDVTAFMLDLRFFSRFLHEIGQIPFPEFCLETLAHGLVLHDGRKMSKHLGNVVSPEAVIDRYGADSLRFYVLAHAEPKSDFRWSDEGIRRYHEILGAFLARIRTIASREFSPRPEGGESAPVQLGKYTTIFLRKAVREIAIIETDANLGRYDRYAGALGRLLGGVEFFATNHLARETAAQFPSLWREILDDCVLFLAPIAPHLAEECWELLGHSTPISAGARLRDGRAAALGAWLEGSIR